MKVFSLAPVIIKKEEESLIIKKGETRRNENGRIGPDVEGEQASESSTRRQAPDGE
jgi:hypothetical protein